MKLTKLLSIIGAGALLMAALPMAAQSLSDSLVVYDVHGNALAGVTAPEPDGNGLLYDFDHNYSDPGQMGHITVVLEFGTHWADRFNVANWSDVVGVANDGGNRFGFISDPMTLNNVTANFNDGHNNTIIDGFVFEGGNLPTSFDVSKYLNPGGPTAGQPANGGHATFISDGDPVPDGGMTLAFLGFALVGVEGLRRKLRK